MRHLKGNRSVPYAYNSRWLSKLFCIYFSFMLPNPVNLQRLYFLLKCKNLTYLTFRVYFVFWFPWWWENRIINLDSFCHGLLSFRLGRTLEEKRDFLFLVSSLKSQYWSYPAWPDLSVTSYNVILFQHYFWLKNFKKVAGDEVGTFLPMNLKYSWIFCVLISVYMSLWGVSR